MNYNNNDNAIATASASTNIDLSDVLIPLANKSLKLLGCDATGNHATSVLKILAFTAGLKTTMKAEEVATATAFELEADTTTNTLNGVLIEALDWILVQLNTGKWQLLQIASLGSAADEIVIATVNTSNGITGIESAVELGNTVYVLPASYVQTITTGAASISRNSPIGFGEIGAPVAVYLESGAAAAQSFNVPAEYVDDARLYRNPVD